MTDNWEALRETVRNSFCGCCAVCAIPLSYTVYECGHKIDRCAGGEDTLENLDPMCIVCNRCKPVHDSIEEYEKWKESVPKFQGTLDKEIREAIKYSAVYYWHLYRLARLDKKEGFVRITE